MGGGKAGSIGGGIIWFIGGAMDGSIGGIASGWFIGGGMDGSVGGAMDGSIGGMANGWFIGGARDGSIGGGTIWFTGGAMDGSVGGVASSCRPAPHCGQDMALSGAFAPQTGHTIISPRGTSNTATIVSAGADGVDISPSGADSQERADLAVALPEQQPVYIGDDRRALLEPPVRVGSPGGQPFTWR